MLTGILTALSTNVLLGWLARRAGELTAIVATLAPVFLSLPPAYQGALWEILSGRGGELSIATYFGMAGYVLSQWRSWKATNQNQVVIGGRKVPVMNDEQAKDEVERATGVRPDHIPTRNR